MHKKSESLLAKMHLALYPVIWFWLACLPLWAQPQRNLLSGKFQEKEIAYLLLPRVRWRLIPTLDEREKWNTVPENLRQAAIQNAERCLNTRWEPLPATLFLEFVRTGNRSDYEKSLFGRREKLAALVVGEALENKGRFLDDIVNGIWAICEESYWGVPGHLGMQKKGVGLPDITEPTVDLFAAETSSLLSWTLYLLEEKLKAISPLVTERIYIEADRRVLTPNLMREDFWWMGFGPRIRVNNWNPWINSNWLSTVLILERNPERRQKAVYKIMRSLDNFLNIYPEDGGCDEGPSYWDRAGASLFDCLELLKSATNGAIDLYQEPLIQKIGQYIYKVHIKDDYFINFADASAKNEPEAGLVYRFGKRINDPVMMGFGAFLGQQQKHGTEGVLKNDSLLRMLPDLLIVDELRANPPVEPLLSDFWLPDLQVMGARSAPNSSKGFYVAALGGHNDESHNHNDVGNFIVYADGKPVLIDVGVETYTAKTFSPQRYEIWTMQSAFHNLPTINGVMQKEGREYQATDVNFAATGRAVTFSLDISHAYPDGAKVEKWLRTLTLWRGQPKVELEEQYSLKEFKEPARLNLMTPLTVDISVPGEVHLINSNANQEQGFVLTYEKEKFSASAETIPISDARLKPVWGDKIARIVLLSKSKPLKDRYKVCLEYRK
ncbi:MAG TPA: heparinase II/III family protein [Terriglobia bacterium]|nr:heparinase II/III family protein [Terriglobia bacterium]